MKKIKNTNDQNFFNFVGDFVKGLYSMIIANFIFNPRKFREVEY